MIISPPSPAKTLLVEPKSFTSDEPLWLQSGEVLPGFTLAYETYGRPNANASNAILVLHGLSGDAHAAGVYAPEDEKPGWWDLLIGPGKTLDTDRFWVISSNVLGSCKGSTGPGSINPATGQPYAMTFPFVTIPDMVTAQKRLLDHLGVEKLHTAIGGSLGGFQALQWSLQFPELVERVVCIASGPQLSAQGIGFNAVGRQAILQDPEWRGGNYYKSDTRIRGLAVARMLAHITYLSEEMLSLKFGRQLHENPPESKFAVESYLEYQGKKFSESFDANSYLYLTRAMDNFDVTAATGDMQTTFEKVLAQYLVISFSSDWLFPSESSRRMAEAIRASGKSAEFAEIQTPHGHDAFLVKNPAMEDRIRAFIHS